MAPWEFPGWKLPLPTCIQNSDVDVGVVPEPGTRPNVRIGLHVVAFYFP